MKYETSHTFGLFCNEVESKVYAYEYCMLVSNSGSQGSYNSVNNDSIFIALGHLMLPQTILRWIGATDGTRK